MLFGVAFLHTSGFFVQVDRAFMESGLLTADIRPRRVLGAVCFFVGSLRSAMGELGAPLGSLSSLHAAHGDPLFLPNGHRGIIYPFMGV